MNYLKTYFVRKAITLIAAFICISNAIAVAQPVNVLFIGNSYTLRNNMPKLFEKIAVSNKQSIHVEMSAKNNHSFKMHCNRPELFEKINSRKWDYVVVQGFSRELVEDYGCIDTASIPYFNKIIDSIYLNNPCTNILLYETWGYKNGMNDSIHAYTFEEMTERVEKGYRYLSDLYNLPIVPVGKVWQEVIVNNSSINLYHEDERHPSLVGSYLTACTFFTAIFKRTSEGDVPQGLDPKSAKVLQETAFNYVMKYVDRYNLKLNTFFVSTETTEKGHYVIKGKSHFPYSDSLIWDFGDGVTASSTNVVHRYAKAGVYQINLVVMDKCGNRNLNRTVTFVAPIKTSKKKPKKKTTN